MFIKTSEYSLYKKGIEQYVYQYENNHYLLFVVYHTLNGKRQITTNPADKSQMHMELVAKNQSEYPVIMFSIKEENSEKEDDVLIGLPFGRSLNFYEMKNETGVWADAAKTVIETNQFVEEMFPGYYITKQTKY